jgi:serine/threonine protein kinase
VFKKETGIVHRDLACRNVLLDGLENALIADFGLSAQTFGRVTQEQVFVIVPSKFLCDTEKKKGFFRGPYKWMAPESLAQNQFSCASDVWSFGVTIWEMLSRRLPFEDKTIYQVGLK